jgi:DNA-binding MarR family transcriptional regulator
MDSDITIARQPADGPALDDLVDAVQQAYPTLWFACHVEHRTRGEPHETGLTDREATVLAHITPQGIAPAPLAAHLGMAKSSLSAHITRLETHGYVRREVIEGDARRYLLVLTPAGRSARRQASPLHAERVMAMLAQLDASERVRAVQGLALLAEGARRFMAQANDRPNEEGVR